MILELNQREREVLATLIGRRLDELGPEIHHTDKRPYRQSLVEDQRLLESLKLRLAAAEVTESPPA